MISPKRSSLGILGVVVAALVVAESPLILGQTGRKTLREALNAYEESAEKLGASGSPLERAQAIKALSILASPRYATGRDRWAADSSRDVRVAVLDAISRMGDGSPEAKAIVLGSLKSENTHIPSYAWRALGQIKLRLDFSAVWRPESPLTAWSEFDRGFGPPLNQVDGIALARPWKDPAWTKLSPSLRLSLLARAGSREAMSLLSKALKTPDGRTPRPWRSWVPAEVVDLRCLREMLDHARAEISTLASFSLVMAKDREHLSRLGRCLSGKPKNTGSTAECSTSVMDEQVLRAAIPFLDREALVALEGRDPAQWLWEVQNELRGRGEPFSYAELEPRVAGLQPLRHYDPDRPYSDAERAAARHADVVKNALTGAIVRESRYDALNRLIARALRQPHPFRDLRDLNDALWAAPEFLASLPADVAHQNYLTVKQWVGDRKPERYVPHYDDTGICEALRTLGTLARGDDYEQLWRDLRGAEDPLEDLQRLIPVIWGFTRRSEGLRRLLASGQRQGWFQGGDNFYDLLNGTEPDPPLPDPCVGRPHVASWDPFGVPSDTLSFLGLKRTLAADLEGIYPLRDTQALGRDFLRLRRLGERIGDPVEALELFWDSREPVRVAASRLFEGARPRGPFPPADRSSAGSRVWYATLRARLMGFSFAPPSPPGPELDQEQRGYLEALLKKEREKFFKALIDGAQRPLASAIVCGGQPRTKALVFLPYAGFLLSTTTYQNEVRGLLESSDADLRHGAAWALWLRFRDAGAVRVFLEDASNPDLMVRARALDALQMIRYPEATPLFPPLLKDSSPELRQVGLWGVRGFSVRSALPEVENLVLDDNAAVAETAIDVLGSLRPPEARPLLMRLLGGPERLAWKASTALSGFRTNSDIDALVTRLVDKSASERERWLILGVLTEITAHPSPQLWPSAPLQRPAVPLAPETTREWQDWWNRNRRENAGEKFRSNVATLVEHFLKGDDREASMASWSLQRLVPELAPYTTSHPPTPRDREFVERWWRDARGSDPWSMLSSSGIVPEASLDLAMEIDPRRTRQQLIAPLLREFPSFFDSFYTGTGQQTLVRFAGVDFGDPTPALCDAREKIVSDWLAWAKKEGWAP